LIHGGTANVFERLPQHGGLAEAKQLLCFSHADGPASSQNDGAHSRIASCLHRDHPNLLDSLPNHEKGLLYPAKGEM
jgi:hypothetical protein